ncbi:MULTISPECIES: DUF6114 domain-containing protein [Heyndrickxia]|uniref:DUF6114 domain-containing protein n=1 Tax=Heyndrickxia TaxID=2837504 RepID=UPI000D42335C|nr:DUF6114 domain-containing protein [Heyndrickxia sporothermodurans]PTY76046.1 hypothetical protein B5V89_19105 [Heyndrickxia sporothermodurans]
MKQTIRQRFKYWRMSRPFWGATLSLLSGLIILYVPLQLIQIAFAPGNLVVIGIIFGGLIVLLGILGYIFPKFHTVFGILTIFLSVLSIMGALGGFFIGTILGIIGGSFSIAWRTVPVSTNKKQTEEDQTIQEIAASK